MRIDAHSHLLPGARDGFAREFHQAGLDYSVVMVLPSALEMDAHLEYQLPISAESLESLKKDNLKLARVCRENPRYLPFAWVDYRMGGAVEFFQDLVSHQGFRGLKIHQVFNGAADANYHSLVEAAVGLKVPVMIHTGFREPARVEYVGALADRHPDGVFICSHMVEEYGLNRRYSHIRMAEARPNVYLECSYVPSLRRLKDAVEAVGDDRVLFGSDYPLWHGRVDYCISVVENAAIPQESKQRILGDNMARLLGL